MTVPTMKQSEARPTCQPVTEIQPGEEVSPDDVPQGPGDGHTNKPTQKALRALGSEFGHPVILTAGGGGTDSTVSNAVSPCVGPTVGVLTWTPSLQWMQRPCSIQSNR